ncbi:MAG: recombinase RecT [Rectinema sp.]
MKANGTDALSTINKSAEAPKPKTLKQFLQDNKSSFESALPKNTINVERFITAAAMEITNNPKLMQCDHTSILLSLGQAARYGLEVGPLLGQAWLIPYNENRYIDGRWQKQMMCHFQTGYRGLIVLARRSQTIKTISAEIVYDNDFIEVELGLKHSLTHKIDIRKERGGPIAYYCIVELMNGGVQFGIISKADAEKHRDKYSKSYAKKKEGEESVWDTNFDEMALKTIVIKALKLCPLSIEALEAVSRAEREDMIDVTNNDYTIGAEQEPKQKPPEPPKSPPAPPENNINKKTKEEDNAIAPSVTVISENIDEQNGANDAYPTSLDVPDELDIF